VTFDCEGDPNRLFAIAADNDRLAEDGWTVGIGRDLVQFLLISNDIDSSLVAQFDHAGTLLRLDHFGDENWSDFAPFLHRLDPKPATIRVKSFQFPDGSGLFQYAPSQMELLSTPGDSTTTAILRWWSGWRAHEKACWWSSWGGETWFDRDGHITDT
jgi:hypothetical protein